MYFIGWGFVMTRLVLGRIGVECFIQIAFAEHRLIL